jgi:hypothetical protein
MYQIDFGFKIHQICSRALIQSLSSEILFNFSFNVR